MRALLLTGSPARYMAPPQLADEQIVAGPDWPDAQTSEGKWLSLRTPVGEYDVATLLARIPADQRPDALVSLVDASWRNQPRNVAAFAGPKALLVADTHHLASPLIGMFKYAATEAYDRIVFLYDRHHLAFFESAGFRNLYWFPGLTLSHDDATVRAARTRKRAQRIAFVGQAGKLHPQRTRLLAALQARDLPVDQRPLPQREALGHYGSSLLGFNASLNGDLNLRVFEILASGATLLTDRLTPESGLLHLFDHGRELLTYSSAGELAERAAHALAHPKETAAIGAAGAAWFDEHFNAARRRAAFQELLFNGTPVPEFAGPVLPETRVYFGGDTTRLLQTMMVYEGMQELHRTEEKVRVVLTPGVHEDIAAVCATLPRVEVTRGDLFAPADIAVFTRDDDIVPGAVQAPRVWCCDAQPEERAVLNDYFAPVGFTPVSEEVSVLCRIAGALAPVVVEPVGTGNENEKTIVAARSALKAGKPKTAVQAMQELLKTNPHLPEAWRVLASAVIALKLPKIALGALTHVLALEPHSVLDWKTRAEVLIGLQRLPEALNDLLRATQLAPADGSIQSRLASVALSLQLPATARAALDACVSQGQSPSTLASIRQAVEKLEAAHGGNEAAEGYDLLITHNEACRLHGTGVLLERYFGGSERIVTLRSQSHYEGKTDLAATHLVLEAGLPAPAEEKLLRGLLANFRIRRILCVPYYEADIRHAVAAQRLTGAPLCAYVMDDQTIYAHGIGTEAARQLFQAADLRLVISPEMQSAYQSRFGQSFAVMPPLLASDRGRRENQWSMRVGQPLRAAMVGNVWSAQQFEQLRRFVRLAGLQLDWFGNAKVPWLSADPTEYESDGIWARGFLPENELAAKLVEYPFVIVPSGQLDGTESNEWLTRLSLPSRMVFILGQAMTPMLVIGHPATAASQFVTRYGLGAVVPYDASDPRAETQRLIEPESRALILAAIASCADRFVLPDAGEWIWRSLANGKALPLPCDADGSETFPFAAKVA